MNGHHGVGLWRGLARHAAAPTRSLRSSPLMNKELWVRSFATREPPRSGNVGEIQHTPHLKRKLGQHLLVTEAILTQIVDAAQLPAILQRKQALVEKEAAGESHENGGEQENKAIVRVLEIGPGTGNLTSALLQIAPNLHVHAVEYDKRMVERLQERFREQLTVTKQLRLEEIDFEKFAFAKPLATPAPAPRRGSIRGRAKARERATAAAAAFAENELRHFDACVANIPYQLSSIIISRLSNYMFRFPDRLQCVVLLVQEEFAQRLLAKHGTQNYSRLSVNTALIANVESVVRVGREHFLPPPKVDSRVIKLTPKPRGDGAPSDVLLPDSADKDRFFQRFDTLLRIAFTRKNKTLRAALLTPTAKSLMEPASLSALTKDELTARVEEALDATGLATKRAVQLPVQDFKRLMDALAERGIVYRISETRHFRD